MIPQVLTHQKKTRQDPSPQDQTQPGVAHSNQFPGNTICKEELHLHQETNHNPEQNSIDKTHQEFSDDGCGPIQQKVAELAPTNPATPSLEPTPEHKCKDCFKVFSSVHALNGHKRYHQSSKTHNNRCHICNLFFASEMEVIVHKTWAHLAVRTGSKARGFWKCDQCHKVYRSASLMINHLMLTQHWKTVAPSTAAVLNKYVHIRPKVDTESSSEGNDSFPSPVRTRAKQKVEKNTLESSKMPATSKSKEEKECKHVKSLPGNKSTSVAAPAAPPSGNDSAAPGQVVYVLPPVEGNHVSKVLPPTNMTFQVVPDASGALKLVPFLMPESNLAPVSNSDVKQEKSSQPEMTASLVNDVGMSNAMLSDPYREKEELLSKGTPCVSLNQDSGCQSAESDADSESHPLSQIQISNVISLSAHSNVRLEVQDHLAYKVKKWDPRTAHNQAMLNIKEDMSTVVPLSLQSNVGLEVHNPSTEISMELDSGTSPEPGSIQPKQESKNEGQRSVVLSLSPQPNQDTESQWQLTNVRTESTGGSTQLCHGTSKHGPRNNAATLQSNTKLDTKDQHLLLNAKKEPENESILAKCVTLSQGQISDFPPSISLGQTLNGEPNALAVENGVVCCDGTTSLPSLPNSVTLSQGQMPVGVSDPNDSTVLCQGQESQGISNPISSIIGAVDGCLTLSGSTFASTNNSVLPTFATTNNPVLSTFATTNNPVVSPFATTSSPVLPTSVTHNLPVLPTFAISSSPVLPTFATTSSPVLPTSVTHNLPVLPTFAISSSPVLPTSANGSSPAFFSTPETQSNTGTWPSAAMHSNSGSVSSLAAFQSKSPEQPDNAIPLRGFKSPSKRVRKLIIPSSRKRFKTVDVSGVSGVSGTTDMCVRSRPQVWYKFKPVIVGGTNALDKPVDTNPVGNLNSVFSSGDATTSNPPAHSTPIIKVVSSNPIIKVVSPKSVPNSVFQTNIPANKPLIYMTLGNSTLQLTPDVGIPTKSFCATVGNTNSQVLVAPTNAEIADLNHEALPAEAKAQRNSADTNTVVKLTELNSTMTETVRSPQEKEYKIATWKRKSSGTIKKQRLKTRKVLSAREKSSYMCYICGAVFRKPGELIEHTCGNRAWGEQESVSEQPTKSRQLHMQGTDQHTCEFDKSMSFKFNTQSPPWNADTDYSTTNARGQMAIVNETEMNIPKPEKRYSLRSNTKVFESSSEESIPNMSRKRKRSCKVKETEIDISRPELDSSELRNVNTQSWAEMFESFEFQNRQESRIESSDNHLMKATKEIQTGDGAAMQCVTQCDNSSDQLECGDYEEEPLELLEWVVDDGDSKAGY